MRTKLITYAVIAIGVVFALVAGVYTRSVSEDEKQRLFIEESRRASQIIQNRLELNEMMLESVGSLYYASSDVTRKEFGTFATNILRNYRFIQALEWIPIVRKSERREFEERARAEGFNDFRITERSAHGEMIAALDREAYFPVFFVEPFASNEKAFGFDLGSNETRLQSLELARDQAKAVATAKITLVQETQSQSGFLIFYPLYEGDSIPTTVADRRMRLEGFALSVYRVGDMMLEIVSPFLSMGVNLEVFDGLPKDSNRIFGATPAAIARQRQQVVMVAGRQWTLRWTTDANFAGGHAFLFPVLVAAMVLIIFLCLALGFHMIAKRAQTIEREVEEKNPQTPGRSC